MREATCQRNHDPNIVVVHLVEVCHEDGHQEAHGREVGGEDMVADPPLEAEGDVYA